jgi:transposase
MPTDPTEPVFIGVDTHADSHHVAVVDKLGRHLSDREFPADPGGYRDLLDWVRQLARVLTAAGLTVIEVNRPDRASRRTKGKSDPLDAYSAAEAVASGRADGTPKSRDGIVESIRCLRVARRSAVKAKTQCINQIRGMLITGPAQLREQMKPLGTAALIRSLALLRPGADLTSPVAATKMSLRCLARRHVALTEEIKDLDAALVELTAIAAPGLLAKPGVGAEVAGQLLVTAGDNPERLRSEASFAHLTGVAPIPASSGRTTRHRLNRGGDRAANKALHTIVIVRLKYDERTRAYAQRRTSEGLSNKDVMRCLKRAIAREIYHELTRPTGFTATTASASNPAPIAA